uniref:Putative salivary lipocalin n=1 Tax=Rhipicephalus pulchellus TaxID=72859 RepID=L7LPX2_RHIPC
MLLFARRILIFCTIAIGSFAEGSAEDVADSGTDPYGCSAEHAGEQGISGYKLLQKRVPLYLVMTTVDILRGYDASLGTDIECLSMEADTIESGSHDVTVTVYYNWKDNTTWHTFGQTFTFGQYSGGLNRMESQGLSGAPSGTYYFNYTTGGCAVVVVTDFGNRIRDDPEPKKETEGQETDGTDKQKESEGTTVNENDQPQCMVWATRGDVRGIQNCCEKYFTRHCVKNKKYQYTPNKCPNLSQVKTEL